jgi:predicted phosphoribosyltransferase
MPATIEALIDRHDDRLRDVPELRQGTAVFDDRDHAGAVLADLLAGADLDRPILLAVPAGGVPVAAALAGRIGAALDVAVVSKVTLPGNTEVGCGAVAFDGTVRLNEQMVATVGLGEAELAEAVSRTEEKVRRRADRFRAGLGELDVAARTAILVDDGLASGFTMFVAAEAVRRLGPASVCVAVPTAPARTVEQTLAKVDRLWCANIRTGPRFAVADAYRRWRDLDEDEAVEHFRHARSDPAG